MAWAAFVLFEFSAVIFRIFEARLSDALSIVAFVAAYIFIPIGLAHAAGYAALWIFGGFKD